MNHDVAHELTPLLALDALDDDERLALERHLESCEPCRSDLDLQREAIASVIPDEPAPDHVWDRIAESIRDDGVVVALPASSRSSLPWIAGVAATIAVVLGVVAVWQQSNLDRLQSSEGVTLAAQEAAGEQGSVVAELTADDGSGATIILTGDGEGFVLPSALPALGTDRTYQLWVVTPDGLVISAGVLGASPDPSRFTWSGEVSGFVLTREVAGGVVSSAGDVVAAAEV